MAEIIGPNNRDNEKREGDTNRQSANENTQFEQTPRDDEEEEEEKK